MSIGTELGGKQYKGRNEHMKLRTEQEKIQGGNGHRSE